MRICYSFRAPSSNHRPVHPEIQKRALAQTFSFTKFVPSGASRSTFPISYHPAPNGPAMASKFSSQATTLRASPSFIASSGMPAASRKSVSAPTSSSANRHRKKYYREVQCPLRGPLALSCPVRSPAGYTLKMATPPLPAHPRQVSILVLDNDPAGSSALRQILDAEGWRVRVIPDVKLLLSELKTAEWSLVIANVSQVPIEGPIFAILRDLSAVAPEDGGRLRVLYLVPSMTGSQYVHALEANRLPYVVRPYHLHDFLEKVSDLLVEVKAIDVALRQVRHEFGGLRKKKKEAGRTNSMFASRDAYSSYTEEELAEYERQEGELSKNKRRGPRTNLGDPNR